VVSLSQRTHLLSEKSLDAETRNIILALVAINPKVDVDLKENK